MRIHDPLSRFLPALPVAAALAFAPAAFAQVNSQVGYPPSEPGGTAITDSLTEPGRFTDEDTARAGTTRDKAGVDKASGPKAKTGMEGTGTAAPKNTPRAVTTEKKKDKRPSGHGKHPHAHVDSLPRDTTVILGTPGSPTTRGVPGTGIEEKR